MASIIIPASKSITITNKYPDRNIHGSFIKVGCQEKYNYISCLYFDISSIPCNVSILSAELVLFKANNFYDDFSKAFYIHPLIDYFSTFTTYKNCPAIDKQIKKNFYPMTSKVAVTIDLTDFVSLWVKGSLPVTGISLSGRNDDSYVKFGSAICSQSYLIPFIKVAVDSACPNHATLRKINVNGTVAPHSKYEAVIEVEVTRNDSKDKNNYYVTDEYDNLLNNDSLPIDKTYTVAIVPRECKEDSEKINFYGSYKK